MARSRHRLTKAITLKTIKPTLAWAQGAAYAFDFPANIARWTASGVATHTALSLVPGWTFSRASAGYALNNAGQLVSFASGAPRITDRGFLAEGSRQNLCLQSQTFDNASWTKNNCTVTANAVTAPDGTLTADKVVEDTATSFHGVGQLLTLVSGTTYTTSVYAKAAERTWMQMTEDNNVTASAYFDLANGVLGTVSGTGSPSAKITALGDGWYLCSLTYTPIANAGNIQARPTTGNAVSSYTGDGTSGIYVWGAQLEASSFPSSYIPTTTAAVTRAADSLTITGVTGLDYPVTLFAEFERAVDTAADEHLFSTENGGANDRALLLSFGAGAPDNFQIAQRAGSVTVASLAAGGALALFTIYRGAGRFGLNDVIACRGGTLSSADTSAAAPAAPNVIRFAGAGSSPSYGYIRRAAIFTEAKADAFLQAITT